MPRLVITKGVGQGRDHAIGTECVLGRAADVDFVVEDVGISRRHARFYREGEAYVVADLGSRNGTFVNSQRVQAASLNDGDLIRVGGVEMVFRRKDIVATGKPQAAVPVAAVAVPAKPVPAIRVPAKPVEPATETAPGGTPMPPTVPTVPTAPAVPGKPARKPLPNVVPTRRRRYS